MLLENKNTNTKFKDYIMDNVKSKINKFERVTHLIDSKYISIIEEYIVNLENNNISHDHLLFSLKYSTTPITPEARPVLIKVVIYLLVPNNPIFLFNPYNKKTHHKFYSIK